MSLSRFREILREQYLLVRLDEERALSALPSLLGSDDLARKAALDILKRVLAARGELANEGRRRLTRIEGLFDARRQKPVKAESAHA